MNLKFFLFAVQLFASTCMFAFSNAANVKINEYSDLLVNSDFTSPYVTYSNSSSSSTVELSWPVVNGANAYSISISENGSTVFQNTVCGTTKTLNGLLPGHTYHCTVTGIINGSQSSDFIIVMDIMP